MPYSIYAVPDRRAVGQLKYQIKRFCKQMSVGGVYPEDEKRISAALWSAFGLAYGRVDFDDDGKRIEQDDHGWDFSEGVDHGA